MIKTYVRWEDGEILGMILTNSTSILIPLSETSNLRVEVSLLGSSKISSPLHVSAPVRSEVEVEDGSNLGPAVTLAVFLTALVLLLIMLLILSRLVKKKNILPQTLILAFLQPDVVDL